MVYSTQPSWRLAVKTGLSICESCGVGELARRPLCMLLSRGKKETSFPPVPPISLSLWLCSSFCKYVMHFYPCKQDFV